MKLTKKQRQEVFNKTGGICAYCGRELQKGWHADHLEPIERELKRVSAPAGSRYTHGMRATGMLYRPENDTIDNMLPTCRPCNLYKSSYSLEEFRMMIADWERKALRESVNYRNADRFGLVEVIVKPVIFYFERENK